MASFPVVNGVTVLMLPPDGVTPDFDNPRQNHRLQHFLAFGIGGPLALAFLLQRFYTKLYLSKGLQIDDGTLHVSRMAHVVNSILEGGMCAHVWEMPLERFERYAIFVFVAAPVYQLCNGFTKLSLLAIYLQLSPSRLFRFATWSSIAIVAAYSIVITCMMIFRCSPVRKSFDVRVQGGWCLDAGILYMATAVSNIVTDVMLFLLPTPMVLRLQMDRAQKMGAIAIFAIASATVATSIVRLIYLPATLRSTDPSWDAAPANVWTFVEGNLFVICGSMPTARRFARHWFPGLFGTNTPQVSKDSARSAIATWGGRARKHRRYSQFEEEDASELELFDRAGGGAEDAASRTERGADAQDGHAGLINSDAETGGAKMQDENRHNCS
ncbi:Pth11-like protein [Cordyceps fumosorosea ARSEF 2679]|uniref:Pth11-like protein n=1 Tax=Cordyceps fumosorosea (strain ARSEF 2679) TaxID=1081104 RepID=A0A167LYP0_CORFA|nr:Pth11-like protein [Cordyceps fumosorosea ARSEF 2679]OAA53693.1 Pth11-like protein [Cordyceps fumosorosea ARSEF 2679]